MKNRKLTILIVLAVGVWGTIGYKIYQQVDEEPVEYKAIPKKFATDTVYRERYDLVLSYDDPFLKKPAEVKKAVKPLVKQRVVKQIQKEAVQLVNWNYFKYMGGIYNSSRKTKTASVKLGDVEHLMKEGETVDGFLLIEIRPDSLKVGFGKTTKFVRRDKN